jgi:uncharacterized RDD family membrane protein YckC
LAGVTVARTKGICHTRPNHCAGATGNPTAMDISSENRFAPPSTTVADVAPDTSGRQLATRSRRLGAILLDGLINSVVYFPLLYLFGRSAFAPPPNAGMSYLYLNMLVGLITALLINGWLLVDRGQTVGKMLLGIRIVRPDGSKVGVGRIALRYLVANVAPVTPIVGGIFGLVDALMIFRKSIRCLHDQIADTIVIRI